MKSVLGFLMALVTLVAEAQQADRVDCYQQLTKNYTMDSQPFFVSTATLSLPDKKTSRSLLPFWREQVRALGVRLGCGEQELVQLQAQKKRDRCVLGGNVCLLHYQTGYFYITKDMVDGAWLIFNRWD